jgi:hypothetical protein
LALGRPADGVRELRQAMEIAERLGHPPTIWQLAGKLVPALLAIGDDDGAKTAQGTLTATVDDFAAGLSRERRIAFLAAPPVRQALAAGH